VSYIDQGFRRSKGGSIMRNYIMAALCIAAAISVSVDAKSVARPKTTSGIETVTTQATSPSLDPGKTFGHTARCPAGKRATGGGYSVDTPASGYIVYNSSPSASGVTWNTFVRNVSERPIDVVLSMAVICAPD
jgi:hypothetical protein